ncbi:SGNH/GDSL hydrolase family protein [Lactiplantibacillus plantarum]|uniref:SGNH/GDSL hydrolase family protein n=1 Tax=Lactiplantibacillus plantarum TaxID=1590 RepID=UPI0020A26D09|nr:SGNH/GDSL hydrolase family protein [Lactiplantibacillus plantarum]UTD39861.1 SGNH/GDSL hydrolase family protein [Lactiplantibacillus plantarum]
MEKLKTNELSLGLNQTFRNDLVDNFKKIQNGVDGQSDALNKQITDLLGDVTPQDQNEVTQARIDVHGNPYGTLKSRADATQATAETALSEERDTSAEVQNARTNSSSKTYPTLKARMDSQENDLNNSINNKLSQISSVPEAFANLAAIKSTYPTGKTGIFVAADNGHKYIWANGSWTDAGAYQSPISLNQMGTINSYHNEPVVITQNVDGASTYWYMKIPKAFITSADGSYRILLDPSNPVSSDGNNGWDLTHIATKGGYLCWDKVNNRINPYLTNESFTKNDIIIGFVWYDGDFSFLGNANYIFNGGYKQSFEPAIGMFVGSGNTWYVTATSTSWQLSYGIGWITNGRNSVLIGKAGTLDATSLKGIGGYICSDPNGTISVYKTNITIPPTLYVIGMIWYDGTVKMFGYSSISNPFKGFLTGYGNKISINYMTAINGATKNIFLFLHGGFPSVISPQENKVYQSTSSNSDGFDLSSIVDGGYIVFDKSTNNIYGVPYGSYKNMDQNYIIVGWCDINYVHLNTDIPYEFNGLPVNSDSPFIAGNELSILTTGDSVTRGFLGTGIVAQNPYPACVAAILKCKVDNVAVSGAFLSKTSDGGSLMPVLKANDLTKYSILTIAYGINDWNDGLALKDVTTALQNAIDYIWQQNPNIRIVGITPSPVWTHMGNAVDLTTPNSAGINQKDFINALVNVYDANQIPVFNLLKYPIVTKAGWKTQSIDGIHPTNNTHKILGTRIATFLKLNV